MQRDKLDFRNEPIVRLFRAMFFPTLVGMLFNSALNIFDGMFVGHGVGSDALAAVNVVAPIFLICTGIGLMLGIGASVVDSIHLSHDNRKAASLVMTQSFAAGIIIFALIISIALIWPRELLGLFGCSKILEPYAMDYLLWLLPGLVFLLMQCIGMMLIRLDGAPKYAMTVQIVGAVLNIVLDYIMVFPMQLGIKGAAQATSISCIVSGSMVLFYFIFASKNIHFHNIKFSSKSFRLSLRNIGYVCKIGLATFISELAIGVTMVTGNYVFINRLGEAGVAAFSVGCYLFPLLFSINNAVAQSAQPIISYNFGAGDTQRVWSTLKLSVLYALICGILPMISMWLGSRGLASIFLDSSTPAWQYAVKGLPLFGISAIFFAINITLIGYYQSTEQAALSIFYTLLRGVIFIIPAFILAPRILGVPGLWCAVPIAEALTTLTIVIVFALYHNKPSCRNALKK